MVTFSPAATPAHLIPFMSTLLSQLSNPCFQSSTNYVYSCDFLTCPGYVFSNKTAIPTPNACEAGPSGTLQEFDYVVLGGGPGGAIVASRLAKKFKDRLVLIIDKSDDHAANTAVPGLYTQNLRSESVGRLYAEPQDNFGKVYVTSPMIHVGTGVGGSSATRDLTFLCGSKRDFQEWVKATGSNIWKYEHLIKYIREMTGASDGNPNATCTDCGKIYGNSGPVSLSDAANIPEGDDAPILVRAARAKGIDVHNDVDCQHSQGITYLRSMVKNGERSGAAQAFLAPVAGYKNLHILRNTYADKILLEKEPCSSEDDSDSDSSEKHMEARVKGIQVQTDNPNCPTFVVKAKREIVLTAGNHNTPLLLLRSGVGRKRDLEPFGVEQKLNLPVGRTYRDKVYSLSYIAVPATADTGSDPLKEYLQSRTGAYAGISLDEPAAFFNTKRHGKYPNIQWRTKIYNVGEFDGDLIAQIYDYKPEYLDKLTELNANNKLIEIKSILLKPKSSGKLKLKDLDPRSSPFIEGEYLTEKCDVDVMVDGLKLVKEFSESSYFQEINAELVHLPIDECDKYDYGCEKYWKCYLKYYAFPVLVAAGTCPMGKQKSCEAVVDKNLKVIGIEGKPSLRISDTSIMPKAVVGNSLCAGYVASWKTASSIIADKSEA